MDAESRFRTIQLRAYELYCRRGANGGSAEEDWREAENEVESEELRLKEKDRGPAKLTDKTHWGRLVTQLGEDHENPT